MTRKIKQKFDFFKGDKMKLFLKITVIFLLAVSCLYLSISLFLNHFVMKDVIPSLVQSSTVTAALTDLSDQALQKVGLDTTQTRQLVTIIQNDDATQEVLENYVNTLIHDVVYQENTFDKQSILHQLESKKKVAYEILRPQMSETEFDQMYQQAIDEIDFDQFHQKIVVQMTQQLDEDDSTKETIIKVYQLTQAPHIYISVALFILSTAYLSYSSLKEHHILAKSMIVTYILSGILSLLIAILIVFILGVLALDTMTIQISSIKYMYICSFIYIIAGIIGYIINCFLKRRT